MDLFGKACLGVALLVCLVEVSGVDGTCVKHGEGPVKPVLPSIVAHDPFPVRVPGKPQLVLAWVSSRHPFGRSGSCRNKKASTRTSEFNYK